MPKVDKSAYNKIGIHQVNKFIKDQEIPLPPVKPTDSADVVNVALIMDLYQLINDQASRIEELEKELGK